MSRLERLLAILKVLFDLFLQEQQQQSAKHSHEGQPKSHTPQCDVHAEIEVLINKL